MSAEDKKSESLRGVGEKEMESAVKTARNAIIDYLHDNECIDKNHLSDAVLDAIGKLTADDARALVRINNKIDLGLFFKSRGPQET